LNGQACNQDGSVLAAAAAVLNAGAPAEKVAAAHAAAARLAHGASLGDPARCRPPAAPARPRKPRLAPPGDVPRRRLGSPAGRAALLHAIAHIEFNAIDLAFDMAVRFAADAARLGLDANAFVRDWIGVGDDEARHFAMVERRLADLGAAYGDLPAHNGLWEAAEATADNFAARLAIAPLVLEARGLDVTPDMMDRLRLAGDAESAGVLQVIYEDEIGHVACGRRWFERVCKAAGRDPATEFPALIKACFKGSLKPPFNHEAREQAGLPRAYYDPE